MIWHDREFQAHLDLQGLLEHEVLQAHQACQVVGAAPAHRAPR